MKKITVGIMGTNQIKHLIPVIGERYQVINLQEIWDKKSNKITRTLDLLSAIKKCDVLYNIYTSHFFWKKGIIAKYMGKKVITHWIGSDARMADEGITDVTKLKFVDKHIACFEPLQKQMSELGVETEYLPIIPLNLNFDICDMPKEHCVLIYMPKGSEHFYGFEEISRVFPIFPNMKFYIVANDDHDKFKDYPNVKVLGYLNQSEMENLYNDISIVVRIHVNDGLSMSVLEGMAKGKYVVWNYDFPYCLPGKTTEEISSSLEKLTKGAPTPDVNAHEYIISEFSKERFLDMFDDIINSLY